MSMSGRIPPRRVANCPIAKEETFARIHVIHVPEEAAGPAGPDLGRFLKFSPTSHVFRSLLFLLRKADGAPGFVGLPALSARAASGSCTGGCRSSEKVDLTTVATVACQIEQASAARVAVTPTCTM